MRLVWYVLIVYEWWRILILHVSFVEIQMFMQPTMVIMSIAATRMYRSLIVSYYADAYVILSFQ